MRHRVVGTPLRLRQQDTAAARRFIGSWSARADRQDLLLDARRVLGQIARAEDYQRQREALGLNTQSESSAAPRSDASILVFRKREPDELGGLGVLERVDCQRDGLVLHVKMRDRTLRLGARKFDEIDLVSFRDDVKAIACGPREERFASMITWRRLAPGTAPPAPGVEGIAVAIEVLPKNYVP